jgi:hypothetical protein
MNGEMIQNQQSVPGQVEPQKNIEAPKSKSGMAVKVVVAAAVLAVIALGAVLAARVWDPVWNPFRPDPSEVMKGMIENMGKVKSGKSDVLLSVGIAGSGNEDLAYTIGFSGSQDSINPDDYKQEGSFNIEVFADSAYSSGTIGIAGETKTKDKISYLKVNSLELSQNFSILFSLMGLNFDSIKSALEGQWIKIEEGDVIGLTEEQKAEQTAFTEKISQIISEDNPLFVKKELNDEEADGVMCYHYVVAVDNEKAKKMVSDLVEASVNDQQESLKASGGMFSDSSFLISTMQGLIENFLDKVGEIEGDLWIGKKDNLLYKVRFEKEIDVKSLNKITASGRMDVSVEINNSDFNKPLEVTAPSGAKKLEEVLPVELMNALTPLLMGSIQ